MKRISKTEALRRAAKVVSMPTTAMAPDGQWIVYGPDRYDEPNGDRTWNYSNSWREAMSNRAAWIAAVAAAQLDANGIDFDWIHGDSGRAREILDRAILRRARSILREISEPLG